MGIISATPSKTAVSVDYDSDQETKEKLQEQIIELKKDLEDYIKDFEGQYGIYYYDLTNNLEFDA